ncbi:MAG TPA: hypothetical protein ENF64_02645 [Hadesarchaea archaeon]|nr:hypothetical protein [Hadesarchaea archaeon]
METKSLGLPVVVGIIVVIAVVAATALLLSGGGPSGGAPILPTEGALIFDDFDDATLGSNFANTSAGMMSGTGTYDPEFEFVPVGDGYALKMMFDFPSGEWCGYWSFMRPDENPITPDIEVTTGYDLSDYTTLKMAVKGEPAEGTKVRFKIEMTDTVFDTSSENAFLETQNHRGTVSAEAGTSWEVVEIPLTQFTSSGPDLDMSDVRQMNIVFDSVPREGTLYIDWIAFT